MVWNPQSNTTLCSLDLSWNSVRMASGVSLGESLAHNRALVELRLAHNSLADPGIQEVRCKLRYYCAGIVLGLTFFQRRFYVPIFSRAEASWR